MSSPADTYIVYYSDIENQIKADGYTPKTSMSNLIAMLVLYFDCEDNYNHGDGDEEGYGDEFSMRGLLQYVEDSGGWSEFDHYC